MANAPTTTEDRALALLAAGLPAATVAASLGVTESRISQLISQDDFAAALASEKYKNLAAHNARDSHYDALEDKLLEKLDNTIGMMYKPMEILKALQVINTARRRGTSTPEAIIEKQQIIQLTVPTQIINNFSVSFKTNAQGQVTTITDQEKSIQQDLTTIQSGSLDSLLRQRKGENRDTITDLTGATPQGNPGALATNGSGYSQKTSGEK